VLESLLQLLRRQAAERATSPLMGSFLISWAVWNYKFIVILFSSATVLRTFELIHLVAFPDVASILTRGLLFPAFTAAAYIFVYPYPAKFVFEFSRRRQKEISDIKRKIEDETPLTIEESRRLRLSVLRLEEEFSQQLARKDAELESLRERIEALSKNGPRKNIQTGDLEEGLRIEASQVQILRSLNELSGEASERDLLKRSKETKIRTEYDLGELVRLELLSKDYRQSVKDFVYEFTHRGRSHFLALETPR
jgi:predicted DNA-binding transcriptional regulator